MFFCLTTHLSCPDRLITLLFALCRKQARPLCLFTFQLAWTQTTTNIYTQIIHNNKQIRTSQLKINYKITNFHKELFIIHVFCNLLLEQTEITLISLGTTSSCIILNL